MCTTVHQRTLRWHVDHLILCLVQSCRTQNSVLQLFNQVSLFSICGNTGIWKSCFACLLWIFLPTELMGSYFLTSFWSMFKCVKIKEKINLEFTEICVSLVVIWVHDLLWTVMKFPSFYIFLKHNFEAGRGARSQVLPLLSNRKMEKKNISLSFLKCRSWKHTLRTTWQWMPFGPLTMFITSNIVY